MNSVISTPTIAGNLSGSDPCGPQARRPAGQLRPLEVPVRLPGDLRARGAHPKKKSAIH